MTRPEEADRHQAVAREKFRAGEEDKDERRDEKRGAEKFARADAHVLDRVLRGDVVQKTGQSRVAAREKGEHAELFRRICGFCD